MKILTPADIARQLGCNAETVRRICRDHDIGTMLTPRQRVLRQSDVAKIRKHFRGSAGNPNWTRKES